MIVGSEFVSVALNILDQISVTKNNEEKHFIHNHFDSEYSPSNFKVSATLYPSKFSLYFATMDCRWGETGLTSQISV